MTRSQPEPPTDRPTSPASSGSGTGGSWRRKSLLAATVVGLGLYLRRRRSRAGDTSDGDADGTELSGGGADATQSVDRVDMQATDDDQSTGRRLGRRLVIMALSTLAFTLARRTVRRIRRAL